MSRRALLVVGLLVALLLAGGVSYYASSDPDGLNKVAIDQGFDEGEQAHDLEDGPFAGYESSGIDNGRLSGAVAGVVGVVVTFALVGGLALLVARRNRGPQQGTEDVDDVDSTGDVESAEQAGPGR
jgi:hypothetical protein